MGGSEGPAKRDPDAILRRIELSEDTGSRGHLKIFFGYAAGVGKTYAMLRAAHSARGRGTDLVVGYVEPHARPETSALVVGLEVIPAREVTQSGVLVRELDLDAVLARAPEVVLVDELAHTNATGSRHAKRYQDVEELLGAGIDVWTTVNVQHLDGLNDRVAAITGVQVAERIPDHVFDDADQVELVDIEPAELMERLGEGKVYRGEGAQRALDNFFDTKNLTALREIALRRCADRVNLMVGRARASQGDGGGYYTGEHVLVCLSSSPSNGRIVRTAARMAKAFDAEFTALLVKAPADGDSSPADEARLRDNMRLAEQLGASVETVFGDDVARQVCDYAHMAGVSKVVLGHSSSRRRFLEPAPLTERIASLAPDLDIYVIPDESANRAHHPELMRRERPRVSDVARAVGVLAAVTLVSAILERLGLAPSNIAVIYVFGVLVEALFVSGWTSSVVLSAASVMVFNYFFTEPRFTFQAWDAQYPATFAIMFLTALLASNMTQRLRAQTRSSAETTYRTQVLLECDQLLQRAGSEVEVVDVMVAQLVKLLHRDIVFYQARDGVLGPAQFFSAGEGADPASCTTDYERGVATWVFKNNKHAGATTQTLGAASCLYLAMRAKDVVYGVVGIVMGDCAMDASENGITLSILGEAALALEKERALASREQAAIVAKNEQLRANLLRSVSHDLRTPLTSISGNASVLLDDLDAHALDEAARRRLLGDIHDDSLWLNGLVENLLALTRFEGGNVQLDLEPELMDDLVDEAVRHVSREMESHHLHVVEPDEAVVAHVDARLVVQVILNLLNNAVQHTPEGSSITLSYGAVDDHVELTVADDGPGIPEEDKARIFERFFTRSSGVADSRRGTGLGLALCRSIIEAHGGSIAVSDNHPAGSVFTVTLPLEELS
jgi:two-component system sensor histidine kinase KdpD